MLQIKYNIKEATMVIISEQNAIVTLKDVSVEKEEGAIKIKGNRYFTYYPFHDITDGECLKKIKDEYKKFKKVGIFKRKTIQYIPAGTFCEFIKTKPYELITTSFAMEIE